MSYTDGDQPGFGALAARMVDVTDDANLADALRRVTDSGCALLANCSSASVTIIIDDRAVTIGPTDETAQLLDDAQYEAGDGPCLTAARRGVLVRIDDTAHDHRWPNFAVQAAQRGIRSSLSVPFSLPPDNTTGGFNLYGNVVAGFTDDDQRLCRAFAAQASIDVSNVQAYWTSLELSRNLTKAMASRAVIEQAKGILMSGHRVGADDAFDLLRERAQTANRKLRDVAAEVVRDAIEGGGD